MVGCVGSIAPEKRVRLAVDTVSELVADHLLVVGDGPDRSEVESHAAGVLADAQRSLA